MASSPDEGRQGDSVGFVIDVACLAVCRGEVDRLAEPSAATMDVENMKGRSRDVDNCNFLCSTVQTPENGEEGHAGRFRVEVLRGGIAGMC